MNFPLDSIHPQARKAGEASLCAAQQTAAAFWAMHDRLFGGTADWSGKENAADVFKGYASELGLDLKAFSSCLDSGAADAEMQAQYQEGLARGISSVPSFYVNDWFVSGAQPFSAFEATVEKALSGQHPPPTPTPLPEGKAFTDPNPERPGYTYGGDAYLGSETAQTLLFQFVDFGSVENRAHALETWPQLQTKYVDSGKVRLLIKHLPASDHPANVQAAQAAECAGRQQAFWPMFNLLFEQQVQWTKAGDLAATLIGYAAQLKLEAAAFGACLDGGQTKDKVQGDMDIGLQNGFPAAPVFFIFRGDQGGYVPTDQLAQALEELAP